MNDTNYNDTLSSNDFEEKKLPQTLNVLTILTYIGCAIFGLLTLFTPMILNFSSKMMEKATTGADLTPKQLEDVEKSRHIIELSKSNLVPLMAIGLIGIVLCFVGAYMMRKLKKDGYWIYVAGEILPVLGNFALLGMAQFTGASSFIGLLIPIVFIMLYTMQRKHLINK
jgi:hypothetical protein